MQQQRTPTKPNDHQFSQMKKEIEGAILRAGVRYYDAQMEPPVSSNPDMPIAPPSPTAALSKTNQKFGNLFRFSANGTKIEFNPRGDLTSLKNSKEVTEWLNKILKAAKPGWIGKTAFITVSRQLEAIGLSPTEDRKITEETFNAAAMKLPAASSKANQTAGKPKSAPVKKDIVEQSTVTATHAKGRSVTPPPGQVSIPAEHRPRSVSALATFASPQGNTASELADAVDAVAKEETEKQARLKAEQEAQERKAAEEAEKARKAQEKANKVALKVKEEKQREEQSRSVAPIKNQAVSAKGRKSPPGLSSRAIVSHTAVGVGASIDANVVNKEAPLKKPISRRAPQRRAKNGSEQQSLTASTPITTLDEPTKEKINSELKNLQRFIVDPRDLDHESASKYYREIDGVITLLRSHAKYVEIVAALLILSNRCALPTIDYQNSTDDFEWERNQDEISAQNAAIAILQLPIHSRLRIDHPGKEVTIEVLYQHLEIRINKLAKTATPKLKKLFNDLKSQLRETVNVSNEASLELVASKLRETLDGLEDLLEPDACTNLARGALAILNLKTLAITFPNAHDTNDYEDRDYSEHLKALHATNLALHRGDHELYPDFMPRADNAIYDILEWSDPVIRAREDRIKSEKASDEAREKAKALAEKEAQEAAAQTERKTVIVVPNVAHTPSPVAWFFSAIGNGFAAIGNAVSNFFGKCFSRSKPVAPTPAATFVTIASVVEKKLEDNGSSTIAGGSPTVVHRTLRNGSVSSPSNPTAADNPSKQSVPLSTSSRPLEAAPVVADDKYLFGLIKACIRPDGDQELVGKYWDGYSDTQGKSGFTLDTINALLVRVADIEARGTKNYKSIIEELALLAQSLAPRPSSPTKKSISARLFAGSDTQKDKPVEAKTDTDLVNFCVAIANLADRNKSPEMVRSASDALELVADRIQDGIASKGHRPSPRRTRAGEKH